MTGGTFSYALIFIKSKLYLSEAAIDIPVVVSTPASQSTNILCKTFSDTSGILSDRAPASTTVGDDY
jgi:hypothetical protein